MLYYVTWTELDRLQYRIQRRAPLLIGVFLFAIYTNFVKVDFKLVTWDNIYTCPANKAVSNMDITTFLSIGIIGVIASLVIQGLKKAYGTNSFKTKVLTVVVALVIGGLYTLADTLGFLQSFVAVLTASSTIYAFFIKK